MARRKKPSNPISTTDPDVCLSRQSTSRRLAPSFRVAATTSREENLVRRQVSLPQPACPLASGLDAFRASYCQAIINLHLDLLPISNNVDMLGSCRALDCTATLLINLTQNTKPGSEGLSITPSALQCYGRAISHLATELSSVPESRQGPLLKAALLLGLLSEMTPHLADTTIDAGVVHHVGAVAIMRARQQPDDVARNILYNDQGTCINAMFLGVSSPYDELYWLGLEPPSREDGSKHLSILQKQITLLNITLPRLLSWIRSWNQTGCSTTFDSAVELAEELLHYKADESENWLLHRVRVVPNANASDHMLVAFAYDFRSLEEFSIAIRYWTWRLKVVQLWLRLRAQAPTAHSVHDGPSPKALQQEQERLVTCLLMSWQYAYDHRPGATWAFAVSVIVLWSVLQAQPTFKAIARDDLRAWCQDSVSRCPGGWTIKPGTDDLDTTSAVLNGGRLLGPVAQLVVREGQLQAPTTTGYFVSIPATKCD